MLENHSGHPSGVNCTAVDAVMRCLRSTGTKRLVLLAIARFVNASSGEACPSNATIQGLSGATDASTVRKCVTALIALGELDRDVQASTFATNIYRLPKLDEWVQMPSELQSDNSWSTEKRDSVDNNLRVEDKDLRRSSEDERPSPENLELDSLVDALSYEFADLLIAAGRKDPKYRSDAASWNWRQGFHHIVFEQMNRGGVEHLREVMAHAAAGPKQCARAVTDPLGLSAEWMRVEQDLAHKRGDAQNGEPESQAPRCTGLNFRRGVPNPRHRAVDTSINKENGK